MPPMVDPSEFGPPRRASSAAAVIRCATGGDLAALQHLYSQLHPDDPPVADHAVLMTIVEQPGLDLLLLEVQGEVLATAYLNVIANLTRGARPYAVIENVVVDEAHRGTGLGQQLMAATLQRAWAAGCYKAMLLTGRRAPGTHSFYRACGFAADEKTAYVARPPSPIPHVDQHR